VKAIRYQAEFFAGSYGEELAAWIAELKTIQDELGGLQDRVVLREAVGAVGPPHQESDQHHSRTTPRQGLQGMPAVEIRGRPC
jgi:CHAD domain-containing protein